MGFIAVPFDFCEDDWEDKEDMGIPAKKIRGIMVINTQHIIAYNEMDSGNIRVKMSNAEDYEIPLDIDDFEDLLSQIDMIYDLTKLVKDN